MKLILNILVFSIVLMKLSCNSNDSGDFVDKENPTTENPDNVSTANLIISVPCEGNSWTINTLNPNSNLISTGGVTNWTNTNDKIRTYFYTKKTGEIEVGIKAEFSGATTLKATLGNNTKEVNFKASKTPIKHAIGKFNISSVGYHYIELETIKSTGNSNVAISDVLLGGSTWVSSINYIKPDWFYWGRRGPSVHIGYKKPVEKNVKWFYNEVTVPNGNDVVGSYFMANGFSYGYFGMQVNSETERRILFSVWSAFDTQDPNQIPAEYSLELLGNGNDVTVGTFGNEGSGAQTYLVYNWKPNVTYKFLLKGESLIEGSIDYTAYFFAPEIGTWKLIASLRRPKSTKVHIDDMYSFLENFSTEKGHIEREVFFENQWVYTTNDNWLELTNARYTADETARQHVRLDYDGGARGNKFYLRNCGFFSNNKNFDIDVTRTANGVIPNIDFSTLEVPSLPVEKNRTLLNKSNWSILNFSTQEDQGGKGTTGLAKDVLDNNLSTFWHSCWNGCTATTPHYITVDMGTANTVNGFQFIQRQNLSRTVKSVEIHSSLDTISWENLGDFTLQNSSTEQNIDLPNPKTGRYFKIVIKTVFDGTNHAALAEIGAYTTP